MTVPFDLASEFHRMGILSDYFKPVPEDYLTRNGRDAVIRCVCGTETPLRHGQIEFCPGCSRVFWCGKQVYAALPPSQMEHDCQPARLTLRSGKTILADYCETCKADIG